MSGILESTKVINGSFGKLYHDGVWMSNVHSVELTIEINYEDVPRSGTRKMGKKATTIDSSGTFTSHKVSQDFVKAVGQIMDDSKGAFVTELIMQVEDPENTDTQQFVRVKGVQFTNIPVMSFEHGSLIEDEFNFVFEDYEFM